MKRFICLMFLIVCAMFCALPILENEVSKNYTVVYADEAPITEETPTTEEEATGDKPDTGIGSLLGSGQLIENNIVFWVAFGLGIFTLGFYLFKVFSSYKKK